MTEPPASDPFATPPGGRPAPPPAEPDYATPPPGYYAPTPSASPPPGYYTYGAPPAKKPKSWMNIVSLSAVAGGLFIPLLANIAGIVFGHLGRRAAKRGEADYAGMGLAGLILNYIGAILWLLGIIAYIAFIVWAVNECATNPDGAFCGSDYNGY